MSATNDGAERPAVAEEKGRDVGDGGEGEGGGTRARRSDSLSRDWVILPSPS